MKKKYILNIFFILVSLTLLSTLLVSKDFLFPFITTKAFTLRILVELALPFYIYLVMINKELRPNLKSPMNLAILGFFFINLISAIFGVNIIRSLWGNFERMGGVYYLAHLVLMYFYIVLLAQAGGNYLKRFLQFLIGVSIIASLNGLSGMLGGPVLVQDPSLPSRASSTFGNPIFFASFLILPMFLSAFFALQSEERWKKIMYWILVLLQLGGIIQSGTRGAMVGLIIGLFAGFIGYLIFTKSKKIKLVGGIILISFLVVAGLLFTFSNDLPNGTPFKRIFTLRDSNSNSRIIQWKIAIQGFKDRPIIGVGSENYYIIGNKYYNPELYKYDRSWFDKPHNYILEILLTNGILGLIAYATVIWFVIIILYKSWKKELLSLLEASILFSVVVVYQIQNLFVFDTIPASLMFYSFLGFIGYLAYELKQEDKKKVDKISGINSSSVYTVFALSGILSIYLIIITNIIPAVVANNVNYGFAYAAVDPQKSAERFKKVVSSPFNFDKVESAAKYDDFVVGLIRSPLAKSQRKFVEGQLKQAIEFHKGVIKNLQNDPVTLQKYSNIQLYNSLFYNIPVNAESVEAINRAIKLAPKRIEAWMGLAQLRLFQGFPKEAAKAVEQASSLDPTNKQIRWQLGLILEDAGETERAVALAEQSLKEGFTGARPSEVPWLIDYYVENGQLQKALSLGEKMLKIKSNSTAFGISMVKAYIAAGQSSKARDLADKTSIINEKTKQEVESLFKK